MEDVTDVDVAPAPPDGPPVGPQIVFAMDADGTCTLSTGPGLNKLGVVPGQLVGMNLLEVYRADPLAVKSLQRALSGESFTSESLFGGRLLSVFYQPVRDRDGTVTGALGVSTDVTEQRRVEAEVRAARERASMLADLSAALSREVRDLEAILQVSVRAVTEAVGDTGIIWLLDNETGLLHTRASWGFDPEMAQVWDRANRPRPLDDYLTAAGAQGDPRVIDLRALAVADGRTGDLPARMARSRDLHTDLRLPLRSRGLLIGAIDVARGGESAPYDDHDIALAQEIAERCAVVLDNALLLDAQRVAHEELLKFKALADASHNLIAINDDGGHALYVNPQVFERGIVPAPGDVWATVSDQVGEGTSAAIRQEVAAHGSWSGDLTLDLHGNTATLRAEVFALHHPDTGGLLGHAWIAQDLTELKTTEAALRGAVADLTRFKALVEASPDFIAIADLDGTVMYVNPNGRELVAMPEDVDATTTTIADYLTPEGLVRSLEVEQPAVVKHGHWEGESTLRRWDGGPPVPVAIASFLMRDAESGAPFALATVQRDISERLAAETTLRDLADQRQALLNRLVDAQDAERTRIAADVHDDSVQALAAVDLRLGLLRRRVRDRAPELLEALDPLQQSVSGATDRLRALLFDLEPPDLQHGLGDALSRTADDLFDGTRITWTVVDHDEPATSDAIRAVAYRVAREALINVRKHSGADNVRVTLNGKDGGLEVVVVDDGVGIADEAVQPSPGHRGLLTMRDRAAVAGGSCTVAAGPRSGTVVTVWFPGA